MPTPAEPVRLLLLADQASWAATLQECLAPLGPGFVLVAAADWAAVGPLFDGDANAVLLTTPEHQPGRASACYRRCCWWSRNRAWRRWASATG